jgi:hypothetical protein
VQLGCWVQAHQRLLLVHHLLLLCVALKANCRLLCLRLLLLLRLLLCPLLQVLLWV